MGFNIGGQGGIGNTLVGLTSSFITEEEFYNQFAKGEIFSWGQNAFGQHGTGENDPSTATPVSLATGGRWNRLARTCADAKAMAAIDEEGNLYTWGEASHLGRASSRISNYIAETVGGIYSPAKWKDVAVGETGMAAIAADGTLWAWGELYLPSSTPTLINSTERWSKVFGGGGIFSAITDEGEVYFWGSEPHLYSLPRPLSGTITVPTQCAFLTGNGPWVDFTSAQGSALLLHENGTFWGWGDHYDGIVSGTGAYTSTPKTLSYLGNNWRTVSIGFRKAAAIKKDGSLWTWGFAASAGQGYLGRGILTATVSIPGTVTYGGNDWANVGMGYSGFIATKKDGTVWGTHAGALTTFDTGWPTINEDFKYKSTFYSVAATKNDYHVLSLGVDQTTGQPTYLSPYGDPIPSFIGRLFQNNSLIYPGPGAGATLIDESGTSQQLLITHYNAVNVASDTVIYWSIVGSSYSPDGVTAANSSDFSQTSGSYTIAQGGQYIQVTADNTQEGTEGFTVYWACNAPVGTPGSISITSAGLYLIGDTSGGTQGSPVPGFGYFYNGPWDVDSYLSPEEEGNAVTHLLQWQGGYWSAGNQNVYALFDGFSGMSPYETTVTNYNGFSLNWSSLFSSSLGRYIYYVSLGSFNGTFANGSPYDLPIYITADTDFSVEPGEGYEITFRVGNASPDQCTQVARTGTIQINDAPFWSSSLTVSPSGTSITEGDTVTLSLASAGKANQTVYYVFDANGTTTTIADFVSPAFTLSGSTWYTAVTHNNNSSSLNYTLRDEGSTESGEQFLIRVRIDDPETGTQVSSSSVFSISDPAPPPPQAGNSSFAWSHYAYGASVGTLTVYWRRNTGTMYQLRQIVGQQHTSSTAAWDNYVEDLSNYNGQTGKIVFRYLSGSSYTGDVQLDGMSFTDSNGNVTDLDPNTASVRSPSKWQKWASSSSGQSSYPTSSWSAVTITTSSSGKWNYDTGGTPSGSTGGTRDSDGSSSGYYIYYESSSPNYPYIYGWLRTTNDLTI